uniref:Ig-like domain-containing protein n=1 Tax=Neogobius melanostomus TaxID=47308 RepID=A0A8C6WM20_9GOBI
MKRRRKVDDQHRKIWLKLPWCKWEMFWIPRWWIVLVYLFAVLPRCCSVHVFVRDEKRYSILFQSVVLPCQYTSVSSQTPVVQWIYKSYCRDRTQDSFSFSDTIGGGLGGGATSTGTGYNGHGGYGTHRGYGQTYESGMASYLDCADSSRTVRTVASVSGSSITLSEYYKNRDISITNKADLRIGEVQWGDSGVYICKVVISDDLEGQNEASVELLVLGLSAVPEDLLPGFDLKIMPEWVFVGAVALGSVLFLLLVGICWCQCCPHSCCCYVSCWCCPDTCCCPRHLYEAGKGIKTGTSTPVYPPYFVSGVPAMVPIAPPSLVDKASVSVPPSDATLVTVPVHAVSAPYRVPSSQDQNSLRVLQYVEKQLAHFNPARSTSHHSSSASELSSLHEGEDNFRKSFRNVQKKALPAILDVDSKVEPEPQRRLESPPSPRYRDNPPSQQRYRDSPPSPQRFRDRPPSPSATEKAPPHPSETGTNSRHLGIIATDPLHRSVTKAPSLLLSVTETTRLHQSATVKVRTIIKTPLCGITKISHPRLSATERTRLRLRGTGKTLPPQNVTEMNRTQRRTLNRTSLQSSDGTATTPSLHPDPKAGSQTPAKPQRPGPHQVEPPLRAPPEEGVSLG